ncbi:haloalkane dehalogenase [Rhizobiales bacterium]|nr:haloalkane dehalogenase [Hongsoonwoonella zoysiae]
MRTTTVAAVILLGQIALTNAAIAQDKGYKLPRPSVTEELSITYKYADVLDSSMSYLEVGEGDPVLFLHGNPTSAYLWRNILPYIGKEHRAIAVDLIGMGKSDKPLISYTFADHFAYLSSFIDKMGLETVTLVGHDWGGALAWEYARRNPDRVKRLAFMEAVLPPAFPRPSFESMGEEMGNMFRAFKDEQQGHKLVIEDNMFVDQVLPGFVNRQLGDKAMAAYHEPFLKESDRAPVLAWPREVPIAGEPAATTEALQQIEHFMSETKMPVLLAYAEPGVLVPPKAVDWYVAKIKNLETAFVGQGFHFIQEDQPDAIGRAIADWLRRN